MTQTVTQPSMQDLARAMFESRAAWRKAWEPYFKSLEPLPMDRFWQILGVLIEEVWHYRFGYKRSNGVQQACWEVMRKALTGESMRAKYGKYTVEEAIRFAASYDEFVDQLDKEYDKAFEFGCCDSRTDLLDSLPLMGRECLGLTGDEDQMRQQVKEHFRGEREKMGPFIAEGENYVQMRLRDAAEHLWLADAHHKMRDLPEGADVPPMDD